MSVLTPASGLAAHRGEGTPPTIRASFSNTAHSTSCGLVLPGTIQDGDIGIICASVGPTTSAPFTTPTGWTFLGTIYSSGLQSSSPGMYSVYTKNLTAAGDAGATVTLTVGTASNIVGVGTVVAGGSGIGVGPAFSANDDDHTTNLKAQLVTWPAIIPGPQDLVILCGGAHPLVSDTSGDATPATPTGFTVLATVEKQVSLNTSPLTGAFMYAGSAASFTNVTLTSAFPHSAYIGGGACALSISPAGRRPTDQVPPSLQGASLHGYGNSYMCWDSCGTGNGGGSHTNHFSEALYITRLAPLMGGPFDFDGYGGGTSADICGGVYGSASYPSRASSTDTNYVLTRPITWLGKSNRSGLVVLDCLGDDASAEYQLLPATYPSSLAAVKCRAGVVNATDAMIRLFRADHIVEQTDGSVTPPAHPTTISDPVFSGGSVVSTTTHGDTITIVTSQPSIDLVLLAIDNAAYGTNGATFSVTVDGNPWTTGTTSDQMLQSPSSNFAQSKYTQMCVPCYNMGGGTHTVVITHTGTSSPTSILCFDGYLVPAATPPIVVLNTIEHLDQSVYPGINAFADVYSALAKTIPSRFPAGAGVLICDILGDLTPPTSPDGVNGWDYTTMLNHSATPLPDYVHPLEPGSAFYAHRVCKTLQEQVQQ